MESIINTTFGVLLIFAAGFQYCARQTKNSIVSANNPQFKKFQNLFFAVYFMALFSDWLQGPYVYKLYAHYGYNSSQIALLYVAGFASSVIFGTTTGPIADRFGRKRMAMVFCFLYSFCCLTKLSSNFAWLMIGRIFGGISTSLLFSTFESWYVFEHTERHDFPGEWISVTFSISTFWNGVLAICAGVAANIFAETLNFGPVAPFMLAIPFLTFAGVIITQTWNENYGNQHSNLGKSCMDGFYSIMSNSEIFYLGVIQSLFEANMYIFVFQWTPILDTGKTPLGMVFACFMVCIMVGSSLCTILSSKSYSQKEILLLAVCVSIISMVACVYGTHIDNVYISFGAFLLLEIAVGLYFPSICYLRSQVIPENLRAGIMNWFRVPTNVITCGSLLLLHNDTIISNTKSMFIICIAMLVIALASNFKFNALYIEKAKTDLPVIQSLESDKKALITDS